MCTPPYDSLTLQTSERRAGREATIERLEDIIARDILQEKVR